VPVGIVPLVRRRLDAEPLRRMLEAIRLQAAAFVQYQSFSHPEPTWRWITPHALAFDGARWRARAWCHNNKEFRDFVLARVLDIGEMKADQIDPMRDAGWQREVTLRLAPHPDLKDGRRKAIELDFGMVEGVLEVRTRVCLSSYVERQLGLDLDPKKVPSNRQQIVLLNRPEVESARKAAQSASKSNPV
jgi:predicted DNA-binding transcriptional regulator YafY